MSKFSVGDKVLVSVKVRGGKPPEKRACTVVEVVPAGRVPKRKGQYASGKYDHVSYIVKDAEGTRYRPIVSRITLAAKVFDTETSDPHMHPHLDPLPVTEYIFCLDASGSMRAGGLEEPTRLAFNAQVEALKASAVGEVHVTVYTFGSHIQLFRARTPLVSLRPLEVFLSPESATRLFDGIGEAIARAEKHPNSAYVLQVLTDGWENASNLSADGLTKMIDETLKTDRWTHAIMLPTGARADFLHRFPSIPAGNVVEWDTTPKGAAEVGEKAITATKSYMTSRAAGATRSSTYFQPNLSTVTEADLARCVDLSPYFKRYEAVKETTCAAVVEERTKKPFVIGSAFYQLTKKEDDVQGYKQILLRHRASGRIFGGAEARKLIGLQMHVDAKVEPGNHGDFEIFIESTSINRILPRGAYMLHDFKMEVPKQPTWDHVGTHAAAEAKKNGVVHP